MVLLAYAQKAAKRHEGIGDLARPLVDHDVVDLTQQVAGSVVDVRARDLGGRFSSRVCMSRPLL